MAESLIEIRRSIASIRKTRKITQALKMVSVAKFRRGQTMIGRVRPYAHAIDEMLQHLAGRAIDIQHTFFREVETGRPLLIVVSADRGLAGSFSNNVIRVGQEFLDRHQEQNPLLVCVGSKACSHFRKKNIEIAGSYTQFFENFDYSSTVTIAGQIASMFEEQKCTEVYVTYNQFRSAVAYDTKTFKLLPVDIKATEEKEERYQTDFIYEPAAENVIDALMRKYIQYTLYRVFCESYAAEQSSRMNAMEAATDNANELIEAQTLAFNRARQATITREISEIIGGAEALAQ